MAWVKQLAQLVGHWMAHPGVVTGIGEPSLDQVDLLLGAVGGIRAHSLQILSCYVLHKILYKLFLEHLEQPFYFDIIFIKNYGNERNTFRKRHQSRADVRH